MDFRALDHCVNIIAHKKNNIDYAMCCAWAVMVDYDKVCCLLGEQSVTGKVITKGDVVGFSALAINQKDIAVKLGENHSDEINKLVGIDFCYDGSAILINNAITMVTCEVINVLHLEGIESDNLVYLKILSYKENEGTFLHMSDFNVD